MSAIATQQLISALPAGSLPAMTPGDIYTVAGNGQAAATSSATGALYTALNLPSGITTDAENDVFVSAQSENCVAEYAETTHTQWGIAMQAGDLYVVAGQCSTSGGTAGLGGAATSAQMNGPTGLAMDGSGDLFIADRANNRIVELAATTHLQWGIAMTADDLYAVAGSASGTSGSSGNHGLATSALLNNPTDVALDTTGNLFIADKTNNRIQEVAQSSSTQFGQAMSANDIYTIAGSASGSSGNSGYSGAATSAKLNGPAGVQVDSQGNLYIADTQNNHVDEVPAASGTQWAISMTADDLYSIAGKQSGAAGEPGDGGLATSSYLDQPHGLVFDQSGDLYISDHSNNRIQELAAVSGSQWSQAMIADDIYTVAGQSNGTSGYHGDGGIATSANLSSPLATALDSAGNLYVADGGNNVVREIAAESDPQLAATPDDLYTVAGNGAAGHGGNNGAATSATISPGGGAVRVDSSGNIYFADTNNNRVEELASTSHTQWGISMTAGDVYTVAGQQNATSGDMGDNGPATSAELNGPTGLAIDPSGDLYISDTSNCQVREVAATTGTQWGMWMAANDIFTIAGLSSGSCGNTGNSGLATSARLAWPGGIALDSAGDLYVTVEGNGVREVAATSGSQWGISMTGMDIYEVAGGGNGGAGGLATSANVYGAAVSLDSSGNLYVDEGTCVQEVPASSGFAWGQTMTANDIYTVAGNCSTAGTTGVGGLATSAELEDSTDLALDHNGDLYIADGEFTGDGGGRIQEVPATTGDQWGQSMTADDMYTIVGSSSGATNAGGSAPPNDGTPIGTSTLGYVAGLTLDSAGNLYLTDNGHNVVQEVPSLGALLAPGGPVLSSETAGGSNPSELNSAQPPANLPQASDSGLSIDSATAELDDAVKDLSIPGRGPALNLSRTYSSFEASTLGPFGYGWTDSYNMYISPDPILGSTVMDLHQENGSVAYFVENASGTWVSAGRVRGSLARSGGGWVFTRDAQETFGFNASGQLISETDLNGNETTLAYSGSQLSSVTDASGRTLTFSYGSNGLVSSAAGPSASSISDTINYAYDGSDNLTQVTDVQGGVTDYAYSSSHLLTSDTNPDSQTTTLAFDGAGRVTSEVAPGSARTTWAYGLDNFDSGTISMTDPLGIITTNVVSRGELTSQTKGTGTPAQATTSYTYDPATDGATSITDPNGHTTTCTYDSSGNLLTKTDPLGHEWSWTFNALNEQLTATNPLGSTTTSTYDPDGNLLSTSTAVPSAGLAVTSYSYSSTQPGELISETNPDGKTTEFGYDSQGDKTSTINPDGGATTATFNVLGEEVSSVAPAGNANGANPSNFTTTNTYDPDGHIVQTQTPIGTGSTQTTTATYDDAGIETSNNPGDGTTNFTHNPFGLTTATTTATGTSSNTYDADGDLMSSTSADGGTTTYTYDSLGHQISTTDPAGNTTTNTYDPAGNLTSQTDATGTTYNDYNADNELVNVTQPDNSHLSYTYDADGNKTSYVDASGNETAYIYNDLDQLVSTTDPLGHSTTYEYDLNGNKIGQTDANGEVTSFTYDNASNVLSTTYSDGSPSVTYSYTPNGKVATMSDGSGTTSYTYDDGNNLISETNGVGSTLQYTYTPSGDLSTETYPNGKSVGYQYNSLGLMTSVSDWNGNVTAFGYDAAGNLNTTTFPNGVSETSSYNNAGAITQMNYSSGGATLMSFAYGQNSSSQISSETDTGTNNPGSTSFSYNSLAELTKAGAASYQYDSSYDLTSGPGGGSQAFNAASELCWSGNTSGSCSSPTSGASTYSYNADGDRVGETNAVGVATGYSWNGAGELTSFSGDSASASYEYDGDGLLTTETSSAGADRFTWSSQDASQPAMVSDGTNFYIYGPSLTPVEQINVSSGTINYLMTDVRGSVRGLLDPSGNVVGNFSYDAWGNQTAHSGSATTPFGFAGAYFDSQSGLYYLLARWYDPTTGQFLSVDPQVRNTLQRYSYAGDDPIDSTDPSGQVEAPFNWCSIAIGPPTIIQQGLKKFVHSDGDLYCYNNYLVDGTYLWTQLLFTRYYDPVGSNSREVFGLPDAIEYGYDVWAIFNNVQVRRQANNVLRNWSNELLAEFPPDWFPPELWDFSSFARLPFYPANI